MAWKLIDVRVNPLTNKDHNEFICDTDADFTNLPKGNPGDTAVSAATANVYVVNASGYWVEFGSGDTGGNESVVGTWMFNESIELPGTMFDVVFASNGNNYDAIDDFDGLIYVSNKDGMTDTAYSESSGWDIEEERTIEILEETTNQDFIAWLKANATMIA